MIYLLYILRIPAVIGAILWAISASHGHANSFDPEIPSFTQFYPINPIGIGTWDGFQTSWACNNYEDAREFFFANVIEADQGNSVAERLFVETQAELDTRPGCFFINVMEIGVGRIDARLAIAVVPALHDRTTLYFETLIAYCVVDENPCSSPWYSPVLNRVMTTEELVSDAANIILAPLLVNETPP